MSDLLDDDLEFRGGTLQLSTDNVAVEQAENNTRNSEKKKTPTNANPSVLSGTDSLTSSTSSFAGKIISCYRNHDLHNYISEMMIKFIFH